MTNGDGRMAPCFMTRLLCMWAQYFTLGFPTWFVECDIDRGVEWISQLVLEDDDRCIVQVGDGVDVRLGKEEVLIVDLVCLPQLVALRARMNDPLFGKVRGGTHPD